MNWNSVQEFFAMGGYGRFVWGSFGMVAALLVLEAFAVRRRWRRARALARAAARREEAP